MTCVYTGAVVWLEDYGALLTGADLHRVGDTIVVRWIGPVDHVAHALRHATHTIDASPSVYGDYWMREDLGVLVSPMRRVGLTSRATHVAERGWPEEDLPRLLGTLERRER